MAECTEFLRLIPDSMEFDPQCVSKLVFCTGRTYYDLVVARKERGKDGSVVLCRVEQVGLHSKCEQEIITRMNVSNTFNLKLGHHD